jgi:hypothetical protein
MIAADTPAVGAVYDRPGSSNVECADIEEGLINKARRPYRDSLSLRNSE